jgi:hypothetical protein
VRSVKEVARAVREIVEGMLARERHEPYLPSDDVLEKLQGFQTVWSAHHYYDRFSRSIKAGLAEIRGERDGTLRMPPDGWLLARERGLSEILSLRALADVVAQLSTEELWVRWIMHGASTIPSGDFDPAVVLFDELASPRWGLQALCERIERTGGGPVLSTAGVDVSAPSEGSFDVAEETLMKFHPLLLRAVFLKGWVSLAAFEGSVLEGLTVLEEFIREAHAFLNSPSIRQALHTGGGEADPTTYEDIVQILAGLNFALSGILPLAEQLAD